MPRSYNKYSLSAFFEIFKQLQKFGVTLLFAVEAQIACNQHRVGAVGFFKPCKGGFVNCLSFGKALLLKLHKFVILLAATAECGREIMRVRDNIHAERFHSFTS